MTATDPAPRGRLVDLSILTMTALGLAAAWAQVVAVDRAPEELVVATTAPAAVVTAPVTGLQPAPAPRRVVVVRRSRAS